MNHIHRFFVSHPLAEGQSATLEEGDGFHAARVLRLKTGDSLELADARGRVFTAEVTGINGELTALAGQQLEAGWEEAFQLTIVQALPSGRKMDMVVEKLSELGTDVLMPVFTQKSRVRPESGDRLGRWRRLARAAASQARRNRPMEIAEPRQLEDWLRGAADPVIVLATEVSAAPLGECLPERGPLTLVVGAEGGFAPDEIERLDRTGARFASLGTRLLRTETAALTAAAIIMHRWGALG